MLTETSGGLMTVLALPQIVYLDFDGELTSYNGEILTIAEVSVEDSRLTQERIDAITKVLNEQFAAQNVRFVSDKSDLSDQSDYSTIYIGKTTAFEPYGSFAGVAETVDSGNKNKSDNAFVILDSTADDAQIIKTIAHETSHLIGTLDHGGDGIEKYAYNSRYDVPSGVTATGITLGERDSMYVFHGGIANSTTVNSKGYLYVSSGGTANSTTVNSCGSMIVSSGGVANSTTINSSGTLYVSSGGTANSTTVNSSGTLYVSSGGTANSTTVNSCGSMIVSSGGVANSTTINSSGTLYVSSGGTANCTTINSSGTLYVSSGGTANSTTVNDWGCLLVYGGGTANRTTVSSGGSLYVLSGGTANSTTVNSRGYLYVSSGGTANRTTVNWGYLYVLSGGTANSTTVNSRGYLSVSSGGTATNVTWTPCVGRVAAADGAVVTYTSNYSGVYFGSNNTLLSSAAEMSGKLISGGGCSMYVMSGGTANSTTVDSLGGLYVWSGGMANSTTVNSGGSLSVFSGGTAFNVAWTPCVGHVYASDGAVVTYISNYSGVYFGSNETLLSSASEMSGKVFAGRNSMYVMSGGTANSTTVNSGGELNVWSGGTANSTTVNSWGRLYVWSGGTANSTTVNEYGYLYVSSGGTANSTTVNSGGYLHVSSGGTANSTTVNWGCLWVYGGGTANSTTVNDWGRLYVFSGGTANSTTVNDGYLSVSSGGTANSTTVNDGYLYVSSGGTANSTTVNDGYLSVSSGGTANSTTVNSGGRLYVYSNGTANSTTVNSGGSMYVFSGGTANSTTVNAWGELTVRSGTANSTTVNAWGELTVRDGGTANNTTVNSGGRLYVYSGGTANNVVWTPCVGYVYVEDGAVVTYTGNYSGVYFGSDDTLLSSATEMSGTVISGYNCSMYVMSGGTANSTTVNSGGSMYVYRGGTANSTTVNSSGYLYVSSGGTANSTAVNSSGYLDVRSGGTANSTTVNSSGYLYVSSGGTATAITALAGARLGLTVAPETYIQGIYNNSAFEMKDAYISGYTVNSGGALYVSSGGTANSTTVNDWGCLWVYGGGTATAITALAGARLGLTVAPETYIQGTYNNSAFEMKDAYISGYTVNSWGALYVSSGGTANSTTVNELCFLFVSSGGTANSTTINSRGYLYVYDGGTVNSTTVNSRGYLYVSSGGRISGTLQIASGAYVSAYTGAIIDFTVAEQSTPETALINDWSLIDGRYYADYTITVNSDQAAGTYILAEGASRFSRTVTVKTTVGDELGSLKVGGTLTADGITYSLALADSTLKLTVSGSSNKPTDLAGDSSGISWSGTAGSYAAAYTQDSYAHSLQISTAQTAVDTYGMNGNYDWRVRNGDSQTWAAGTEFTAVHAETPQTLASDADGAGDLFFGKAAGVWNAAYQAQHLGAGSWQGTGEYAEIAGKNKITDVFSGSTDANLLVLSDDENGDALFLDDIYSAFPSEQKARLSQIKEIRAGAGDDVVDLTSQRFSYTNGVTLRGGDGDDVLWANCGDNKLFGDSGNDRIVGCFNDDVLVGGIGDDSMNGGGGNDIFCFCKGWGKDTVEQLSGGTVTLWFVSGSDDNWDPETMTYTAGANSVKVSGVSTVTLKFGDDGSGQYDELVAAGAFMEASSFNIFEEENKGMVASL